LSMKNGLHPEISRIVYSIEVEKALKERKRKDPAFFARIGTQILKILREPNVGKPLRYTLKNRRRIHIGSFVLVYEFHQGELRFLDFDHHDRIYKKR
jgi:mRNA-degrading endonuclease RelE of RelBE toxin-antitoxin system